MNRVVFLETVLDVLRPTVAWSIARGDRVFLFDFVPPLKSRPGVRALLRSGKLAWIYVPNGSPAGSWAIEAAEEVFARCAQHQIIRALGPIFGEDEVETVMKKALVEALFRYAFIQEHLQRHLAQAPQSREILLSSATFWFWEPRLRRWPGSPEAQGVRVSSRVRGRLWSTWHGRLAACLSNVAVSISLACHLACLWLARRVGRTPLGQATSLHAYAVDQPFQVKFQGPRGFAFLLDHETLTKHDIVFLIHPAAEGPWVQEAQQAGYRIVRLSEFPDARHPNRYVHHHPATVDLRLAGCVLWQILTHPFAPRWIARAAASGIMVYLTRSTLLERVQFINYVYMNQDGLSQQWLNALIRRHGRRTWEFAFSIGGGYLYGADTVFGGRQWMWAYKNPDHVVATSAQMIEYLRGHRQRVRAYHNVGNLWSELVRTTQATTDVQQLRIRWFGPRVAMGNVMAWFDTTFVEAENSPSTYTESIAWYRDLHRLLEEDVSLFVVIKPSKAERHLVNENFPWAHPLGEVLLREWERLRRHPRVYFAGSTADPAPIIAASDLTVTFCFSSPTAEALGAGKKAFWYEPGDRWRRTPYASIPLVVAHGYDELRAFVKTLLHELSDEAYARHLRQHVLGRVEEFLDGQGLSRFRTLLTEAVDGQLTDGDRTSALIPAGAGSRT